MLDQILNLTKQLISIPSTKENIRALRDVIDIAKRELFQFNIEEFEKEGSPSILVHNGQGKQRNFKIVLNAHLDVVPGSKQQYNVIEKKGKLYGRGAIDMKSACAVKILVFREVAKKINYPLALQLVTDEEIGGFYGTKYQLDQGVRAGFAIAGEGTDLNIKNEAKGVLWANLSVKGKAAHAAYLWQGTNAIRLMNQALIKIMRAFPEPKKPVWKTTLNISKIASSNQTFNKVAEDCEAGIDIRYIPQETESVVQKLQDLLPPNVDLQIKVKEPAQFTEKNNDYIKQLRKTVQKITGKTSKIILGHGASDIRHFNSVGGDGVEFGPIGYGLHTDEEWVNIKSLSSYFYILKSFLEQY